MERTTAMWTLVAFFGATVAFGLIREATEGQSKGVMFGAQAATLVVVIVVLVLVFRERE
ncbi:MAG: hypothetical protein WKF29_10200 [Thermoleophilaceae bacterium]